MAFDSTKHHVELNGVPYQIRGYQKSELSTFIPRLGSGDQEESQFDLLRSKTFSFEGGMLQRIAKEDTQAFTIRHLYPKYDDGVLYPVTKDVTGDGLATAEHSFATSTSPISGARSSSLFANLTAQAESEDYKWVAMNTPFGTDKSELYRIDKTDTVTKMTLPTNIKGEKILSMVIWNNQVWLSTQNYMGYMATTATTITEISAGTGSFQRMVVFNNQLYGTYTASGKENGYLFRYTGDTTTRSAVTLGKVPNAIGSDYAELLVYNNRIILTHSSGMYAYDGVIFNHIEDKSDSPDDLNYRLPAVLRGYLYYFMPDGYYRFNGSLIEKLYDISEIKLPQSVVVAKNRLWYLSTSSEYFGYSRYHTISYNQVTQSYLDFPQWSVFCFNGKGFYDYTWYHLIDVNSYQSMTTINDTPAELSAFNGTMYIYFYNFELGTVYNKIASFSYAEDTIDTTEFNLVTSIYDAEFPMIDKVLEEVEIIFDGKVDETQNIDIVASNTDFDVFSDFDIDLGTVTTIAGKDKVILNVPAGVTFKKLMVQMSGTMTTGNYGIEKVVLRYLLTPDVKWQWTANFLCYGDNDYAPLQLADTTDGSQLVSLLRGNIYDARESDVPVGFIDVDRLDLNGAINASVTTITLNTTNLLKSSGYVQIEDEIIYYSGKTSTTLTGCQRGVLGTTGTTHADNSAVYPYYRVIVRQIQNERIELTDPTANDTEDENRASEITLTLQEV